MKKLYFFLLCIGSHVITQAQQLRPDVLASAGTSMSTMGNTARLSFTIGEAAITGASLPAYSYGQGFHNGVLQTVNVTGLDLAAWGIEVWPNPVVNTLFLKFNTPASKDYLSASIWNLQGQSVMGAVQFDDFAQKSIAVGHLPTGVYLLRFADPSGKSISVKFVKAD